MRLSYVPVPAAMWMFCSIFTGLPGMASHKNVQVSHGDGVRAVIYQMVPKDNIRNGSDALF